MKKRWIPYTPEQIAFLTEHVQGTLFVELTKKFNTRFHTNKSIQNIKSVCWYHGLHNGIVFHRGKPPPNPFPKGGRLGKCFCYPVGYEKEDASGFISVKVADPDCWKLKHHLVWERHNGPLPKGSRVIFADGNKKNFAPDNLIQLTYAEYMRLLARKLLSEDAETNKTAALIAKVATRAAQLQAHKKS